MGGALKCLRGEFCEDQKNTGKSDGMQFCLISWDLNDTDDWTGGQVAEVDFNLLKSGRI